MRSSWDSSARSPTRTVSSSVHTISRSVRRRRQAVQRLRPAVRCRAVSRPPSRAWSALGFEVRWRLTSGGEDIWAQVTRGEADALGIAVGDTVTVRPRAGRPYAGGLTGADDLRSQPLHVAPPRLRSGRRQGEPASRYGLRWQAVTAWAVVGLDNGGSSNNATVPMPTALSWWTGWSRRERPGPPGARSSPCRHSSSRWRTFSRSPALRGTRSAPSDSTHRSRPSADGVILVQGIDELLRAEWRGFDVRTALEERIGIPVVYNTRCERRGSVRTHRHFGVAFASRSSVSMIRRHRSGRRAWLEQGSIVRGAPAWQPNWGTIQIRSKGLLDPRSAHAGVQLRLYPETAESLRLADRGSRRTCCTYWLIVASPGHATRTRRAQGWPPARPAATASRRIRSPDRIFEQAGRSRSVGCARSPPISPTARYFLGGGVVEAAPRSSATGFSRPYRRIGDLARRAGARRLTFALVPDLDMAGGAAIRAGRRGDAGRLIRRRTVRPR